MKDGLDVRQGLRVFNKVRSHGERSGQEHQFRGLHASSDFDGYTLHLHDSNVDLFIYFHNSYRLEYPSRQALESFLHRLQALDRLDTELH